MTSCAEISKATQRPIKRLRVSLRLCLQVICVLSALLLMVGVVTIFISPAVWPCGSLLCLAFPLFFILNTIVLVAGLFVRRRMWIMPLVALLFSLPALRAYSPVNFAGAKPNDADTLRILTFNTRNFGGHEADANQRNFVAGFMFDAAADIVCFQEGASEPDFYQKHVIPLLRKRYPYYNIQLRQQQSPMGIFSRWPLVDKEIVTRSGSNVVVAYRVMRSVGDTIRVVNCHLSSIGLSEAQRGFYSATVHGYVANADTSGGVGGILRAFCAAAGRRALMADTVAAYIAAHREESLIVCGDFNDTPVSYAVRRVASGLTDCYRAAGNGIGRTFCRDAIVVRIDHLFCSSRWQPVQCRVVPVETRSDHYPLLATLVSRKS